MMRARAASFEPAASLTWPFDRMRRKARRLAVRLLNIAFYCVEHYSAAVQHEELRKLSRQNLERCGIAPGDLHRHIRDALPQWPER